MAKKQSQKELFAELTRMAKQFEKQINGGSVINTEGKEVTFRDMIMFFVNTPEWSDFDEELLEEIREEHEIDEEDEVDDELIKEWIFENIGNDEDYFEYIKEWYADNYGKSVLEEYLEDMRKELKLPKQNNSSK